MRPSRRWGNTNSSRGKIRRWSKEWKEVSGDTDWEDGTKWQNVNVRILSTDEVYALAQEYGSDLPESVLEELATKDIEDAVIYEMAIDVRPSAKGKYGRAQTYEETIQRGYFTEDDFMINDLFTARGKNWSQRQGPRGKGAKGRHLGIEGYSQEFDYHVLDIETPVSKGEA